MPATRTETGSTKVTSTRSLDFGRCCVHGSGRIAESRRRNCLPIYLAFFIFTHNPESAAKPCSPLSSRLS
jgi:hypothetical protein